MTNEDKGQKESCEHGWELNSYSQADDGLPVSVALFCPFCDARWESDNSLTARETALVEALQAAEWSPAHGWELADEDHCGACFGRKDKGHKPDCEVAKALAALEGSRHDP